MSASANPNASIIDQVTETVQHAANYVTESAQGLVSGASKEANKEVAKDSSNTLSDRASAGLSAASDKISETSHNTKADAHKEIAKN